MSIGCPNCREDYRSTLKKWLENKLPHLCSDCQRRFHTNPLRILDCKKDRDGLKDAPKPGDYLCKERKKHFDRVIGTLKSVKIPFEINPYLVRGLDYYTKTVFEFILPSVGAQNALGGGGRYDELIEAMGGPPTPGQRGVRADDYTARSLKAQLREANKQNARYVLIIGEEEIN